MSSDKSSIISQQNLSGSNRENDCTYEFEDFRLDAAHLMLYRNKQTISLQPKVVETLVALVEKRGEVISKDELMNRLWADSFVEESNLTQNIYLLRKTLGDCADGQPFIETFSRRGYRFNGEIKPQNGAELLIATHTKTQTVIEEETTEYKASRTRNWLLIGAIAACSLLIVSGFAFFILRNNAAPFQNFKFKRQTDKGDASGPIVSQDGKFIAYTDSKNVVWLKNTATDSSVKILTGTEGTENHLAAISPDNNYIYIIRSFKEKKAEIIKISLFGGAVQQKIVEDLSSNLSLSPDGRQVSFIRTINETGENAIIVADTDGAGERKVVVNKNGTWFGMWGQSTAWSPDGNRIACAGGMYVDGKEVPTIRIFRAADGEEVSLIKTDSGFRSIDDMVWLPDGNNLLAISDDKSSQGQIFKYTISTGEWRRVTNDLSNYVNLSVTSDGKNIITIQEDNIGNLWLLPASGDLSQIKQITFGRNLLTDVTGVSWTPDGKIVYATNASGRWEIWIIDADGLNQKQLTQNCAGNDSCSQPVASPNGRYIVFQATRGGVKNIWRMDLDGANATQLTDDTGVFPSITPDGRFVLYSRQLPPANGLWQVPIEGGKAEQFSKIIQAAVSSVSPDGKLLAFHYYDSAAKQPDQTCVAPIGADAPEKCFGISRAFPRWTADGKAFYYLDHGYAGIWKQPLDGTRELFLEFPGERTDNFAFSPNGKQLVVARSRPTQDIVALTDEH